MKRLLAIVLAVAVSTAWHTPQSYAAAWDLRFQQYDGSGVLRAGNVTVSANSVMGFDASKAPITIATSGTGSVVKQTAPTINNATLGGNTVAGNIAASGSLSGSNLSGSNTGDQLAYANIIVGNVTIPANSTAGNVTLIAGANITLTPDATNRTITIVAAGGGGGGGISGSISSTGNIIQSNGSGAVADSGVPTASVALKNPTQTDLATGTVLTVGTEYFDSASANRTITFTGTATEGAHISLTLFVSAACTWTIPASYRWGESSSVTTLALRTGYNFLRWDRTNSLWMLTDTVSGVVTLSNQTVTTSSVLPIGNTTADGKTTVADVLALGIDDTPYDATSWNAVTTKAPSANAVRDKLEALAATTVTKATNIQRLSLTLDTIADGMSYTITRLPAAFTVTRITCNHEGSGLSSPSVVATFKHGTNRTSGTTIEAVTATSSTTGTEDDGTLSDGTIPANSFVWVELSSKSGTTAHLFVELWGTYD